MHPTCADLIQDKALPHLLLPSPIPSLIAIVHPHSDPLKSQKWALVLSLRLYAMVLKSIKIHIRDFYLISMIRKSRNHV